MITGFAIPYPCTFRVRRASLPNETSAFAISLALFPWAHRRHLRCCRCNDAVAQTSASLSATSFSSRYSPMSRAMARNDCSSPADNGKYHWKPDETFPSGADPFPTSAFSGFPEPSPSHEDRITWAFAPPNPNELTQAYSSPSCGKSTGSLGMRRHRFFRSIAGFTFFRCRCGGTCRFFRTIAVLIRPAPRQLPRCARCWS